MSIHISEASTRIFDVSIYILPSYREATIHDLVQISQLQPGASLLLLPGLIDRTLNLVIHGVVCRSQSAGCVQPWGGGRFYRGGG